MYKKFKKKIKTSIQYKLAIGLIGMTVLPVMLIVAMCITSDRIEEIYKQDLNTHIIYNEIFLQLEHLLSELEQYVKTDKEVHYERYMEAVPKLIEKAENLEENAKGTSNQRQAIDLKYMVKSYTEKSNQVAAASRLRNYEETLKGFEEIKYLNTLITEKYNTLYRSVSSYTVEARTRVGVTKRLVRMLLISLLIGCLLIEGYLVKYISKSVIHPIKKLQDATTQFTLLEGQKLTIVPQVETEDEIGRLSLNFYKMQEKILQQVEELKEKMAIKRRLDEAELQQLRVEKLLRESELKALQARINPHFIFNSLNLIVNMAYIEGAEETAGLMEALADFLRYNLDKLSKTVTLKDELDNIKDYVAIQTRRFGNRITFVIEEDITANDATLPCLIIQPLVENAIIHGVGMYTEGGEVGVKINREEDYVRLMIYDNGVGMDATQLKEVDELVHEMSTQKEVHIGLHNVFARLNIFFNDDVHIEVTSEPGIRTVFDILIPYKV